MKGIQRHPLKTGIYLFNHAFLFIFIYLLTFIQIIQLIFSNTSARARRGRGPSFKLGGVAVNAKSLYAAEKELEALDLVFPSDETERSKWVLDLRVKSSNFDDWSIEDDSKLLRVSK